MNLDDFKLLSQQFVPKVWPYLTTLADRGRHCASIVPTSPSMAFVRWRYFKYTLLWLWTVRSSVKSWRISQQFEPSSLWKKAVLSWFWTQNSSYHRHLRHDDWWQRPLLCKLVASCSVAERPTFMHLSDMQRALFSLRTCLLLFKSVKDLT